jgi:hypothetical protein
LQLNVFADKMKGDSPRFALTSKRSSSSIML